MGRAILESLGGRIELGAGRLDCRNTGWFSGMIPSVRVGVLGRTRTEIQLVLQTLQQLELKMEGPG